MRNARRQRSERERTDEAEARGRRMEAKSGKVCAIRNDNNDEIPCPDEWRKI